MNIIDFNKKTSPGEGLCSMGGLGSMGGGYSREGVAPAAATGYNPSPGSKPPANHVPGGCTNPLPPLTLITIIKHLNIIKHIITSLNTYINNKTSS